MYTMEYYSAIKGNKTVSFAEMQMSLEMWMDLPYRMGKSEGEKQISYIEGYM